MKIACRILFVLSMLALAAPAVAGETPAKGRSLPKSPDELELIDVGTVTEVQKSDIVVLGNGKTYHLDQIRVPVFFEDSAIGHLKATLQGQKVGVYSEKKPDALNKDRNGVPFIHLMREDGTWVQADMVARGIAWAYSTEDNRALILPLYRYEETARQMKAGFWARPEYAIKTAADIGSHFNSYQIYQGKISSVHGDGEYLVFNCDTVPGAPSPFSFRIRYANEERFAGGRYRKINSKRWTGAIARLRGWVDKGNNGLPVIELTHLEQMEFIDPGTGLPTTRME